MPPSTKPKPPPGSMAANYARFKPPRYVVKSTFVWLVFVKLGIFALQMLGTISAYSVGAGHFLSESNAFGRFLWNLVFGISTCCILGLVLVLVWATLPRDVSEWIQQTFVEEK